MMRLWLSLIFLVYSPLAFGWVSPATQAKKDAATARFLMNQVMPSGRLITDHNHLSPDFSLVCKSENEKSETCRDLPYSGPQKFCGRIISDFGISLEELNVCGHQTRDINSENFSPPSLYEIANEFKYVYIPDSERRAWVSAIERARRSVTDFCCAEDGECKSLMTSLEVRFCDTEDPKDRGRCFKSTYYSPYTEKEWEEVLKNWGDGSAENFKFPETMWKGFISLSPFGVRHPADPPRRGSKSSKRKVEFMHRGAEVEEFIHACSEIRHRLSAKGSVQKRREWMKAASESCNESTEHASMRYQKVEGPWSSKEGLIKCFENVISLVKTSGNPYTCLEACTPLQMEEATAAYSIWKYQLEKNPHNFEPEVLPNGCLGSVTSSHPPRELIFQCALDHDFEFRQRVRGGLGCR